MTKGVHRHRATRSPPPTTYKQRRLQPPKATFYSTTTLIAISMMLTMPPHMPPPPSTATHNPTWSDLRPDAQTFEPGATEHRRKEQPYNRTPPPHPPPTTSQKRQHQNPTLIPPPPKPTHDPNYQSNTRTRPNNKTNQQQRERTKSARPTTEPDPFFPSIVTLNVEGITTPAALDDLLSQMQQYSYDAMLLQETWRPGQQDFVLAGPANPGCRCVFQGPSDTPRIGSRTKGGVGILLSKRLADLTSGAPATFGHNGISIDVALGQHTLTLGSMYLPDQGKLMPAYNAAIENLERMMDSGRKSRWVIIGSDTNAHVAPPMIECLVLGEHGKVCAANPQGRALVDCLATRGYALLSTHFHQMITTTTYAKATHRSQLDHLLVRSKDIQWHSECQNVDCNLGTNSPHSAVHTILKIPTRAKTTPIKRRTARTPPKRDYQKLVTDADLRQRIQAYINTADNPFAVANTKTTEQQQREFRDLYSTIATMIPPVPRRKAKAWISPGTALIMLDRNQAQLQWKQRVKRVPTDPAVATFWLAYRQLREAAKNALNDDRHAEISRILGTPLTGTSQQAWSIKKALQSIGSNRRQRPKTPRYLDPDGKPATSAQQNSDITTAHYEGTMTRPDMAEPNVIDRIEVDPDQAIGIPDEHGQPIQSFAPTEETVVELVNSLKHGKGEGPDKQVVEILSVMVTVPSGRRIVHGLYLSWWNDGKPTCPSFWLQARLVIVPKTNPPSLNLNKTRGITLGTLEAKLMGAFNTYWLERWLANHDVENQSGFRAKRGREDALFVIRQLIAIRHEYDHASFVCLIDQVKAFPSAPTKVVFAALRKLGYPEELVVGIESLYAGSTVEIWIEGIKSSFEPTGGVREGGMDSPSVFKVLVIVALMIVEYPDTFNPPTVKTSFDGRLTGRTSNAGEGTMVSQTELSPQVYADDQTAVYGAGSVAGPSHKANDIDQRIPGAWMAQSQCQLEIIMPTPSSAPMPTQSLSKLTLQELRALATQLNITPTGDRRRRATYETAINNATVAPSQNKLDAVVTAWNNDDRTVTVQPVGRSDTNDSKTIALNHPWEPNPEWRLTPGSWLVGSIIVEQWTADEQGKEHPPYVGTVLEWYDDDKSVLVEYKDFPGETERVQLDDPTTHRSWKLLQTRQHLELDPHPGFKDRDQFFIGCCALCKANVDTGMEPHSAPRGSTTKSKTQAVLIPARGSSQDDYNTDPIIIPAYNNGTALRPEGQVDVVAEAGCLGDTIGSDLTEVQQTDARVSAASKMWYALIHEEMLLTNRISRQAQGSVYRACVISVLLDSTANWAMRAATYQRLRNFHRKCVRMLNRVTKKNRISATTLANNLGLPPFTELVNISMLRRVGKVARMPPNRLPRQMMCAWMNGTRPKGRPNDTFGRRLSKTLRLKLAAFPGRAAFGTPQNEIATWHIAAQDQSLWNAMTEQPT